MVDKKAKIRQGRSFRIIIFVITMLSAAIIIHEEENRYLLDSLQKISGIEWTGIYSRNEKNNQLEGALRFSSTDFLPMLCDLLFILDPKYCNFDYLSAAIRNGCHLFLNNKLNLNIEERKKLIYLAKEGGTIIQIRNDFLFQPFRKKMINSIYGRCFIEARQSLNARKEKLEDLIVNNLILILKSANAPVHKVDVFCGSTTQKNPDIINIHINFVNGTTATLTLTFNEGQNFHYIKIYHENGNNIYDFSHLKNFPLKTDSFVSKSITEQVTFFLKCIDNESSPEFSLYEESEVYLLLQKIRDKFNLHSVEI